LGHFRISLKHAHQEFVCLPGHPYVLGDLRLLGRLVWVQVRMREPTIKWLHTWRVHRVHTHVRGWWVLNRLLVHLNYIMRQLLLVDAGKLWFCWNLWGVKLVN
jgi:hypothetical protein